MFVVALGGVLYTSWVEVSNQAIFAPESEDKGACGLPVTNLKGLVSRSESDIFAIGVRGIELGWRGVSVCGGGQLRRKRREVVSVVNLSMFGYGREELARTQVQTQTTQSYLITPFNITRNSLL